MNLNTSFAVHHDMKHAQSDFRAFSSDDGLGCYNNANITFHDVCSCLQRDTNLETIICVHMVKRKQNDQNE